MPRPGAASRAHHGILFLDELPEFAPHALQALRQPMESGVVEIHRARMSLSFPARFQLVAAANPCACGNLLEGHNRCTCSVRQRRDYYRRIGGPIFDRVDLSVVMRRLRRSELAAAGVGESTARVAERVAHARERQIRRYAGSPWLRNADVPGSVLRSFTSVPEAVASHFDEALLRGELTMRGVDKALRLAWTIADLNGHDTPDTSDFSRALLFRARAGGQQ